METLLWGFLFGTIGTGYFIYGRKVENLGIALVGLVLMGFPYFVSGIGTTILIGVGLCIMPFILRKFF